MAGILVSGVINLETTLRVDAFPIAYSPVRYPFFGIGSRVSGVGYNIARALATLGRQVRLLSLIGVDPAGRLVQETCSREGILQESVLARLEATAQSVILYDQGGRRQIHVDLKDIQERSYPAEKAEQALEECSLAVLCNINFSRPLLARARALGRPVVTDVHEIAGLDDPYNQEFLQAADVLFMSDARIPCDVEEWARLVLARCPAEIVVIGMGAAGAFLAVRRDGTSARLPAAPAMRPIINTIGAGDALLAAFVDGHLRGLAPMAALRRAMVFAAYKIGEASAADGYLTEPELEALYATGQRAGPDHSRS